MIVSNKKNKKKQSQDNFKICMGEHDLEQVKQIKYLGVVFDDKLSWQPHIQLVCSKLSTGS